MPFYQGPQTLRVRQIKEMLEVIVGWEKKNRYEIQDDGGATLGYAVEEKSGWFLRNILGGSRPFEMLITDRNQNPELRLIRPFRWFFPELTVQDSQGRDLGRIRFQFAWLNRLFQVSDAAGNVILEIKGPILKPWTFFVHRDDTEMAVITKKWSGFLKEAFTDADNFGVIFHPPCPDDYRPLILGAVFLIDFMFFETNKH